MGVLAREISGSRSNGKVGAPSLVPLVVPGTCVLVGRTVTGFSPAHPRTWSEGPSEKTDGVIAPRDD